MAEIYAFNWLFNIIFTINKYIIYLHYTITKI